MDDKLEALQHAVRGTQSTLDAAAAPGPSVDDKLEALQHAVRELRELLLQDVRQNEKQGKKKINVFEGAPDVADLFSSDLPPRQSTRTRTKMKTLFKAATIWKPPPDDVASPRFSEVDSPKPKPMLTAAQTRSSLLALDPLRYQREKLRKEGSPCLIGEFHPARQTWDLVSSVLILISIIQAPLDIGFSTFIDGNRLLFAVDIFGDVFFLADVLLNFFTTYSDNGNEVRSARKIWSRYLRGWFLVDVPASIPFSLLSIQRFTNPTTAAGTGGAEENVRVLKALKLLKLGRVFRLKKAAKLLAEYLPWLPTGALSLIGLIGCQLFMWHAFASIFWLVNHAFVLETLSDSSRKPDWKLSYRGGCYDHPPYYLPSQFYLEIGQMETARFYMAIEEEGDWGMLDAYRLARWSRSLLGGEFDVGSAAVLSNGSWPDVAARMPSASLFAQPLNLTTVDECAGYATPNAIGQLASVLVEASQRRVTLYECYVYSLFHAIKLTVGEISDSTSLNGIIFAIMTVFVFIYFQSLIVGYVCNVIDNLDAVGKAQREALVRVRLFLKMRKVDRATTRKIITFLDHTWQMHGGTIPDTQEIMEQLPKHLQEELIRFGLSAN